MSRLLCDDADVAEVEIADTPSKRMLGLLKRDSLDGALVLPRTSSVHTFKMRFPIDVAFCDRKNRVISIVTMQPNRLGRPRISASYVVEAGAGRFAEWGVKRGSTLTVQS